MNAAELALWLTTASAEVKDARGFAGRPHPTVVQAIADASIADPALGDAQHTASLLLVIAFRESSYRADVIGDGGRSCGLYQSACASTKLRDPVGQTRIALTNIRRSISACPDAILAVYASGTCGNVAGRRISVSRVAESQRLIAMVPAVQEGGT
jgi:hypothetical protein